MALDPDVYRNLADLTPAEAAQADELVRKAEAAAVEAEELAGSTLGSAWRSLIGAESTSAALVADAKAARSLAVVLAGKRAALTRDRLAEFLGSSPALGNEQARATARLTSPTGAVRDVGAGIAKDAAAVAQDIGRAWIFTLKAVPFLLIVAGLGYLAWKGRK